MRMISAADRANMMNGMTGALSPVEGLSEGEEGLASVGTSDPAGEVGAVVPR